MAKTYKVEASPVTEQAARDIKQLNKAKGYDALFLSKTITVKDNLLSAAEKKLLPKVNTTKNTKLDYTNLSVYYNSQRKMPFYSAYNINLSLNTKAKRAAKFLPDPRVSADVQLDYKPFYNLIKGNKKDFDIGHMAACNEMAWGKDGQLKSLQTFFFTNTCPQAADLNEKLWNQMEQKLVTAHKGEEEGKLCVFTGPILGDADPYYTYDPTFQLALRFFKVIVFEFKDKLYSTALVMSHIELVKNLGLIIEPQKGLERLVSPVTPIDDFPYKGIFQVNLSLIKELTGFNFAWKGVSAIKVPVKYNALKTIDKKETPDIAARSINTSFEIAPAPVVDKKNPLGFVLVV
jgi:endonuclease G